MSLVGLTLIPILLSTLSREPSAKGGRDDAQGARGGDASSASAISALTSSSAAATAVAADEGIDDNELNGLRPPPPAALTAVGDSLSAIASVESTWSFSELIG